MVFQFQCPQGHLLEAEEVDGGKTFQCPYCGLTLAIPMPAGNPSPSSPLVRFLPCTSHIVMDFACSTNHVPATTPRMEAMMMSLRSRFI